MRAQTFSVSNRVQFPQNRQLNGVQGDAAGQSLVARLSPLARILGLAFVAALLASGALGNAEAQTAPGDDYKNPERRYMDPNGVSIDETMLVREVTPLSIGDASSGLVWTYHGHGNAFWGDFTGEVGGGVDVSETVVKIGETYIPFENGTSYTNGAGTSATLAGSGSNYVYTAPDGTAYTITNGALASILRPNGVKITIYAGSVVSNTGYALKFDSSTGTISAVNMLAHNCDTQAVSCDAYDSYAVFSQGYSDPDIVGTGGRYQVTDAMGNFWRWRWMFSYVSRSRGNPEDVERGPGVIWAYKDAMGVLQTMNYGSTGVGTSYTDPRGTFTYGQTVTDPSGATLYSTGCSTMNVDCISDGLGRSTKYTSASFTTATIPVNGYPLGVYTRITDVTHPEGNSVSYTYNARGNVTQTVSNPKPGSGLGAITVYQAGYDTTCTNQKTCNQPNWTKDAKGNQTDYTYDATHGGVLTVTLPTDQNGLRLRTYHTYTAYDTGNGLIYRPTRSESCGLSLAQLSLTACPAAATTSVTITDYGTATTAPKTYKSFQPYSVTQTDGAGSLSATTTFTYDNVGNVVVVDGPRTDVDDRSYTTYDADRRPVFEIGVDPDGGGALPRVITHHVYSGTREIRTETGTGNATDGSDFTVKSFTRMTFDAAGRVSKTEEVLP